ncbi:MAG: glycosyltransferase family 1 protein [Gemmatimonadota bacterium]
MGSTPTVAVDARMIDASGVGTYLKQLLPRLALRGPDIDFVLLARPELVRDRGWEKMANVRIVECDAPLYSIREQFALSAATPRGTDLFWSPHYVIPLLRRGPLLVTVHDVCHLALSRMLPGPAARLYARTMFQMVRRRADAIIMDSEFTRREFLRLVGTPRAQPEVIHIGVDASWSAAAARERPSPDRPYFIHVGNIKPHKNLRTLLEAFAQVEDELDEDLLLVGRRDGLIVGDPEATALAASMADRVRFTGVLEDEELQSLVAGATALVFPSLYEGFGLPPLEAMAAGCPTIVADAASMPEVCGDAVRYFDPHDAAALAREMRAVASEPPSRERREHARRHAEGFNWDRAAERTDRVIRATLGI